MASLNVDFEYNRHRHRKMCLKLNIQRMFDARAMCANLGIISEKCFLEFYTYAIIKRKTKERNNNNIGSHKSSHLLRMHDIDNIDIRTCACHVSDFLSLYSLHRFLAASSSEPVYVASFTFHYSVCVVFTEQTIEAKSVVTALLSNRSATNKIKNTHMHQKGQGTLRYMENNGTTTAAIAHQIHFALAQILNGRISPEF